MRSPAAFVFWGPCDRPSSSTAADRDPRRPRSEQAGYSNDQLAIRNVVEVVAQLVMHGPAPDNARRMMLATLADALLFTEPRD
jgi:hypothetical protein